LYHGVGGVDPVICSSIGSVYRASQQSNVALKPYAAATHCIDTISPRE
jgi:hypothetical protein